MKKKDDRKKDSLSLKEVIDEMFEQLHLTKKVKEQRLIAAWSKLMGTTIASRTKNIYVHDKILYVYMSSSALKHEMNMSKSKILSLFLTEFGESIVNDIVIK